MAPHPDYHTERTTAKLRDEELSALAATERASQFQVVPVGAADRSSPNAIKWRVRFELNTESGEEFGLEIYDDVVLGRGDTGPDYVDLSRFNALALGVSRRHALLRPTASRLFVIDLGSTNGTRRNGHSIGRNTPYGLADGDVLSLGSLQFMVRLVERPRGGTSALHERANLADALAQTAKAITSHLDLDEVLMQVAEQALYLTSADQAGVWLVDEHTGEIRLEGQRGIEDKTLRIMGTATRVGWVIESGQLVRENRETGHGQIKLKTGRLVDAMLLVPISVAGVTFGVLGAFHLKPSASFNERDESLLSTIADFAAIAVQNARLYQTTDRALARRVEELAALNDVSRAVTSSLDVGIVHDVLVARIRKHWQVKDVLLWLVDEDTGELRLFPDATSGRPRPVTARLGEESMVAIAARVVKAGQAEVADFATRELPGEDAEDGSPQRKHARSMACVPLLVKGEAVGALALVRNQQGMFGPDDLARLQTFANPVATAIQNARLFSESEHERGIMHATASALSQPLIILSEKGDLVLSNDAANALLKSSMSQVFDAIARAVGITSEVNIGGRTYLATVEHSADGGTIAVMQDITYLKQLEAARGEFVHALSHDLKSPLTSINGFAELIERLESLTERGVGYLGGIRSAVDRMHSMITQLLDVALLSEGATLGSQPCDVIDVAERARLDLSGAALEHSMRIDLAIEGEPYGIRGDGARLYRSVVNLLDNAIKYATPGTPILITLRYGPQEFALEVLDDGPGIPDEDIDHVFEKYYRGKQSEGVKGGHGLGLVLVRATARAHGGEATAANVPGHGAAFTMTFPASLRAP